MKWNNAMKSKMMWFWKSRIYNSRDISTYFLVQMQTNRNIPRVYEPRHRGLKLDGAIGQGEICNSLKIENFSKSFQSNIGKNKIKF